MNANGKLLDVWLLVGCERCRRTSKVTVHERIPVRALPGERLRRFENNDPAVVRSVTMGTALRLDWTGTWELETDLPFYDLASPDPAPLEVVVRFELPVPIRVGKLLMAGFRLSRSTARDMVGAGRIRLPLAIDATVRADFTFAVVSPATGRAAAGRPGG